MEDLTLIDRGYDEWKVNFCLFQTNTGKQIKVTVTAERFVALRKAVDSDLETICRCAAKHALCDDPEVEEVDVMDYYPPVKKEIAIR
jgi:hypothetical protein